MQQSHNSRNHTGNIKTPGPNPIKYFLPSCPKSSLWSEAGVPTEAKAQLEDLGSLQLSYIL